MRKLPILLLLVPLLLMIASCSDDDDAPLQATAAPAATATQASSGASADAAIKGTVHVDFTGAPQELKAIDAQFEVAPGSTAWEAIKLALGEDNLDFEDFGGDLGIFISGFNGVAAEGNHFWEFQINGEPATVGVGKYEVQQGDVLEFVYSSF